MQAQNNAKDSPGTQPVDTSAFKKVEKEAAFPGGDAAWKKFVEKNMDVEMLSKKVRMPRKAKQIIQTAIIQFVVGRDGHVEDIKTLNPEEVDPAFRKEAERIISISPAWTPAEQDGRKVRAYRKQPITFMLERD
jgi:protein TonB